MNKKPKTKGWLTQEQEDKIMEQASCDHIWRAVLVCRKCNRNMDNEEPHHAQCSMCHYVVMINNFCFDCIEKKAARQKLEGESLREAEGSPPVPTSDT